MYWKQNSYFFQLLLMILRTRLISSSWMFFVVEIVPSCPQGTAGTSAQQQIYLCKQKDQKLFEWIWFYCMWSVMWLCLYPNPAPVAALTSRSRTLFTALEAVRGSARACCSSGRRNFSSSFLTAVVIINGFLKMCHKLEHYVPDIACALVLCLQAKANNCMWLREKDEA